MLIKPLYALSKVGFNNFTFESTLLGSGLTWGIWICIPIIFPVLYAFHNNIIMLWYVATVFSLWPTGLRSCLVLGRLRVLTSGGLTGSREKVGSRYLLSIQPFGSTIFSSLIHPTGRTTLWAWHIKFWQPSDLYTLCNFLGPSFPSPSLGWVW